MTAIDLTMAAGLKGEPVTTENTDKNLLAELGGDFAGWVVADLPYMRPDGFRDGNNALQCVFSAEDGRAGLVVTGGGSSGHTSWTDASSLEDAFRRHETDDMSP